MSAAPRTLAAHLARLPLVAILRGIAPDEAVPVGRALLDEGWSIVEVPLNSPRPLDSIAALARDLGDRMLVGAGTVTDPAAVADVRAAGGALIVAPNADPRVIAAARARGLACMPGVMTPTEAFAALDAGADALKLFPAEALPPAVVAALLAVLPKGTLLAPVGGIGEANIAAYWRAGARGFGIGSSLYKPGTGLDALRAKARALREAALRARADVPTA